MSGETQAGAIRGKTIRFIWTAGPTKGKTHEHVFAENGTVTWREPGSPHSDEPGDAPKYAAVRIADEIHLVSYLAGSGYTLTVALNLRNHTIVGFASGTKEWYPIEGTLQVIG
jgi:hypothetical protein